MTLKHCGLCTLSKSTLRTKRNHTHNQLFIIILLLLLVLYCDSETGVCVLTLSFLEFLRIRILGVWEKEDRKVEEGHLGDSVG